MLVLSSRVRERIVFPAFRTAIQVVSVQAGVVRLGVEAPAEVRVLREALPDREAEWGPPPEAFSEPSPLRLNQLVDRRLEVARLGLSELRQRLRAGHAADAETILEKLDEDLHLLRRRVSREVEQAPPRPAETSLPDFVPAPG
ncbi:MAG TPA: carbon storage regulator [Gemmataceae bacterium]|jgi:carbon storage regulator CsrA|nr:carbon storage regulator [Gemmataceae bacterium]